MNDSGATGLDDDVIRRLRELYDDADDGDKPRAALYLGLALADRVAGLPADHPERGDLAEEGLARLVESADDSPAAATATERLKNCRPATVPAEPAPVPFRGGDLNWDLDWAALRGPAEAGRNLAAMLPFLATMLPPHDPTRNALTNIKEVLDAFERGQWTPEGDAVLSAAIEQVEVSGLGAGTALVLRVVAMMIRMQRCQQVLKEGGQPDWPSLAELDRLIDGLESARDLETDLGTPFVAVQGLHHIFIASVVMMRILVSYRAPGTRQDAAWRDDTLRLIDQADDHLRLAPPAYAGLMQPLRGRLAAMFAALSGAAMPAEAPPARPASRTPAAPKPSSPPKAPPPSPAPPSKPASPPRPAPPPKQQFPTVTPAAVETPATAWPPAAAKASAAFAMPGAPAAGAAAPGDGTAWWSDPALSQISPQVLSGLQAMTGQMEGATPVVITGMLLAMDAVNARKWDSSHDARLAEVEARAARLTADEQTPADRAMVAATLAVAHVTRSLQLSGSPQPGEHPSAADFAAVLAETESAIERMDAAGAASPGMADGLVVMLHAQAAIVAVETSRLDVPRRAELLARARGHFDHLPAEMRDQVPVVGDMTVLARLMADEISPDDPAVDAMADRHPNLWDREGLSLRRALIAVGKAQQSRAAADIEAALGELQTVWAVLSAGSPVRARVLIAMATMQSLLTVQGGPQLGSDTASIAIAAVRTAPGASELCGAAHILVTTFVLMLSRGEHQGPFQEAAAALRTVLAGLGQDDWMLRVTMLTGIGAATALDAAVTGDEAGRAAGRQAITDAERALPEPRPAADWYTTARLLCTWTTVQAVFLGDDESARLAVRLADTLETLLSSHPELTSGASGPAAPTELEGLRQLRQQLAAAQERAAAPENAADRRVPAAPRPELDGPARQLARDRLAQAAALLGIDGHGVRSRRPPGAAGPDLEALRACAADLHAALPAAASDTRLRHHLDLALGICHAELYGHGPAEEADQCLGEAITHLNRALATADHDLPTAEWADTLDVLAQCLREASQRGADAPMVTVAERVVRAALRELADCVLIAGEHQQAVDVAARASEIVVRAIGWCLADGQHRAAVDIAETGRGLVLASVVLAGRVEEILRGADRFDEADAWSMGDGTRRAAALNAVRDTTAGHALLHIPIGEETAVTLAGTSFDAVVYLVPPTAPDVSGVKSAAAAGRTGHAVLIPRVQGPIEVLDLPALTGRGGTPLDAYQAALDEALAESGRTGGFRSGPAGQAWVSALDEAGRWAYEAIMGPLLGHVRDWKLGHLPHLALIPLGALAAIPYAAAWTDSTPDGKRRYAIDDAVLSYAASARLLGETARRPRRPLSDRVVLVTNPGGDLPMTRRATRLLASRQYQDAEVYGTAREANGAATVDALLGALPAKTRPGASLLQLSTHGRTEPAPGLQAANDDWLALTRILDQARGRAADAPGGLVITNACLTDTTRTHYDESLTLATAFLAGGATAVIGTRWPVDDGTTAVLSLRLHYYLQLGRPPAEALRQAQLDLLRPAASMRATLDPVLAELTDAQLSQAASWAGHVHHGI